jgi:DNA polymerase-3 subunit delta'
MSFQNIKGQDKVIQLLQEALRQNRLASSYLFLGPEASGKKMTAITLAKAANCLENSFDPCERCISCLKIEKNQHPDVHIITSLKENNLSESEAIKIEDIRQLQKDINLRPYEGKKKIFIIDNAHNLTAEASNALLKILEEPPAKSLIILISSKPALLFKTIISRCQILRFSWLSRIELERILKKDYRLNDIEAHFLAYFCEGRLGYALRLKDTDIMHQKNMIIDEFISPKTYGSEDLFIKDRQNMRRYLNILAAWFRDIYLVKIGTPHINLINLDRRNQLLRSMNRYSFGDLDVALNFISDALSYLEENINMKLVFSNLKYLAKG